MNKRIKNTGRKPKYTLKKNPPKAYQKPLIFVKEKWEVFRSYSTKKQILISAAVILGALLVISIGSYLYFIRDIKNPERLMNRKNTGILILDRNGETIYSFGQTYDEEFYTLDQISDHLEEAVIASEDSNFYEHSGFSIRSIGGALIGNILNRDSTKYGGSTISQQLVKNTLLTSDKNYLRKYQELSIAIALEQEYSKDEILEMYLNSVYFGEGAFGIGRASEVYFDKTPQELTLAESSILIGALPAPALYSPISGDPEESLEQRGRVLNRMLTEGKITEEELTAALNEDVALSEASEILANQAPHFTQMVLAELTERYGEETVTRSGFTVKTTLDLKHQKSAEEIVSDQISRVSSQGASNSGLVAIDPKTSEIIALVGSVDWENEAFGQVNMAVTPRQPGSSFKPIYFSEAINKELITASTILEDKRRVFSDGYTPENYDFRFRGDVTTRYALGLSLNLPAIEVMEKLGIQDAADAARRMGIEVNEENQGLSFALGTAETTLLDMTNAYAALANNGKNNTPQLILSIEDKFSKTIFEKETGMKIVQSEEAAYITSSMLSDESARAGLYGTSLNLQNRKAAMKTGTTNDNKDAWTIGYTPNLVVGVWVGNNDNTPMNVAGGSGAGPIWKRTMETVLQGQPDVGFNRPSSVVEQNLCSVNGSYKEYYIKGTEPDNPCYIPTEAELEAQKKREEEEQKKREEEKRRQEEEEAAQQEPEETTTEEQPQDTTQPDNNTGSEEEQPTEEQSANP